MSGSHLSVYEAVFVCTASRKPSHLCVTSKPIVGSLGGLESTEVAIYHVTIISLGKLAQGDNQ